MSVIRRLTLAALTLTTLLIPLQAKADDAEACDKQSGDEAIAACTRAIESGSGKRELHFLNRSVEYRRKGNLDQAIADATEALRLDPNLVVALANRSSFYRDKGDLDRALVDLDRAIELAPTAAKLYFVRGDIYTAKNDRGRGIADFSAALRLDPRNAGGFQLRGDAYVATGDFARAVADYDEALRIDPSLGEIYFQRASAKRQSGDVAGGDADLARSKELGFVPPDEAKAALATYSADSKCCGPVQYGVTPGNYFIGRYPKYDGVLVGTADPDGRASGLWVQPHSDRPCADTRRGSRAWGRFAFRNTGSAAITGEWGYCDEPPNRPWGFQ